MEQRRRTAFALGVLLAGLAGAQPSEPPRHLIYLHGRIVQETQDPRPRHGKWGHYELAQIAATFRERGFLVSAEIRPKAATLAESADAVAAQVRRLLDSGVPIERIAVVGGSMGAAIAIRAAARLQNRDLRFAMVGACLSGTLPDLEAEGGARPIGRLLVFRDLSDETSRGCVAWQDTSRSDAPLRAREVVLDTGLDHGFLYRPLPEWVDPLVEWLGKR